METKQVLSIMKIVSWVIFIGLCIKTGAIIISFFVSFFVNPEASKNIYLGLDFSSLCKLKMHYLILMASLLIVVSVLKAHLFYLVIKIFSKINIDNPFSVHVANLITKISYITLSLAIISKIANSFNLWLITHKGRSAVPLDYGYKELFFMAGILFIIAYIFKRGVELQTENELTI